MSFRPGSARQVAWIVSATYLLGAVLLLGLGEELVELFMGPDPFDLTLLASPGWAIVALTTPLVGWLTLRVERQARAMQYRHEMTVRHSLEGILLTQPDGRILMANPTACRITGFSEAELIKGGRALLMDDSDPEVQRLVRRREREGSVRGELWYRHRNGHRLRVEVSSALFSDGRKQLTTLCIRDLSDREQWAYRERLLDAVYRGSTDGIAAWDSEWRVLWGNPTFEAMTGFPLEEAVGHVAPVYRVLREDPDKLSEVRSALERMGHWRGGLMSRRRDGELYPLHGSIVRVASSVTGEWHYVATFTDRSEVSEYQQRLRNADTHDAVTNLPNRFAFEERFQEALSSAAPHDGSVALFLINLDNFKNVNQSLGHAWGDECLRTVGARLSATIADAGYVARLSGDSFFVMADGLETMADSALVARRLRSVFNEPLRNGAEQVALFASIGISVFPTDGRTVSALMQAAESALGEAKSDGGDDFRYYAPGLEARARDFVSKTADIREGLRKGQFVAFYQPIVASGENRVAKFEVLARWRHPQRGLLGPGEFISIAERSGLIGDLSEELLRQAVDQLRTLDRSGWPGLNCTVNLSARQFNNPDMVGRLTRIIAEGGLTPSRIDLEITESLAMLHAENKRQTMQHLKAAGFRIYMDDFGTGYSSLNYLRRFALDGVKIDRSFIFRVPDDKTDAAIVRAILAVARELDLLVIAEGIETESQAAYLRHQGCQMLQGFHFARPMESAQIATYLAAFSDNSPAEHGVRVN